MMKPEFHVDFPATEQHTPGYFFLQGASPGFSPPVSSGLFNEPALAERRGTSMVGQTKASCWCPPPLYCWVENTFSFRTLPYSALFSPAGHATAKHQRPAARLDEKGIAGVFDALHLFVSLQRDRMKPIHKRRVPQQPFRRDN